MKRGRLLVIGLCCLLGMAVLAQAEKAPEHRFGAKKFTELPAGVMFPEGITANAQGEIIVGTFSFAGNNKLLRYDRRGKLLAMKDFGNRLLLGLAYNDEDDKVYICNFGNPNIPIMPEIQRIEADFVSGTPVETVAAVPFVGPPANRQVGNADGTQDTIIFGGQFPAPNAMAFAENGDLFFSDSFQGAIFSIIDPAACTDTCNASTLVHDPLLATAGQPPFGANGLVLAEDEMALYVANTGDDRVLNVNLNTLEVTVFAESLNGADGLTTDKNGLLLVAANQADEIVALDQNGKVVAKYGESSSLQNPANKKGLLFPASMVMLGKRLFVTNLAFPFTTVVGDEPEEDVQRFWISVIRMH